MQKESNVYYCYSPKLRKFLGLSGLRWGKKGFNEDTKSYYWTFNKTETLYRLLEEYDISNSHNSIV